MRGLDLLPCPVLVTDASGQVLAVNAELLRVAGGSAENWQGRQMDLLLPPPSRIFMQTHVWPMLLRSGNVREIHLQLVDSKGQRVPVLVSCQSGEHSDAPAYFWVMFVATERIRFEAELVAARDRADALAAAHARSERFIKTITDAISTLVGYWDKDLRCRFANAPYGAWFGKRADQIVGALMPEVLGEALFALNEPYVRGVFTGQNQQFERTLTGADGKVRHALVHFIPDHDAAGAVVGMFALLTDITQVKQAESELRLAASVVSNTVEGIMVTDAQGVIQTVNPAFTSITGFSAQDAVGQTPRMLKSGRHDADFFAGLWADLVAKGFWEGETWNRRIDGELILVRQTITAIPGSAEAPVRYVSVFNDITARWHDGERLRHLAFHDALTDLPNRALLLERLGQLIVMAQRESRQIAVLFLDLDEFKAVNDTMGHEVGDELLREVGRRLVLLVRKSDTVARLGGDEFVVLLDNPSDRSTVDWIAQRIVESIRMPMEFAGHTVRVGASVGIAMHALDGHTPEALLACADAAMYRTKRIGKAG